MRYQRRAPLLINFFVFPVFAAAAVTVTIGPRNACPSARSGELQSLRDADQKDRDADWSTLPEKTLDQISARDDQRRKRVAEIFAEGCIKTGGDYYNAALVFQHGTSPDHFFQTYIWASRAVALGKAEAGWLVVRGIDRYLMDSGYKQIYATQGFSMPDDAHQCICVWPVETSATDDDRRKMSAKTLAEQLKWADGLNAGKSCKPAEICRIEAKPVPRGSLAGVAW
jgi:hypothetical protein